MLTIGEQASIVLATLRMMEGRGDISSFKLGVINHQERSIRVMVERPKVRSFFTFMLRPGYTESAVIETLRRDVFTFLHR